MNLPSQVEILRGGSAKPHSQPIEYAVPVPVELSVIVPTFNERDNIPVLVERLAKILAGIAWEVIFVDDDSSCLLYTSPSPRD